MKTTTLFLILFLTGLDLWAQTESTVRQTPRRIRNTNSPASFPTFPAPPAPVAPAVQTEVAPDDASTAAPSSNSKPAEEMIPAGNINFQGVDVSQVLEVYAQLVGRTLLRAALPSASIVLKTATPLTKTEAIEALQAVLALNGISVVNVGEKFVKVLPMDQANSAGAEFNNADASQLPDLGTYVTHIVQLKYVKPSAMVPIITPFAKLPNSILPIEDNGILVLRDNAENVKRMLEMIDQVDVSVPAVYVSEVIPIKYALAEDIANALNSLGGAGGSTVSIGSAPSQTSTISGVAGRNGTTGTTGAQGANGFNTQQRTTGGNGAYGGGGATANGTPAGGTTFQQRLQSIIQRASSGGQQDQIQVFGQAKIIADQRANALLVFATQPDMERIKNVVAKLDVLLSQVLIESVIVDVTLGNTFQFGVSAAQNPHTFSPSQQIVGAGGINNGNPFLNFIQSMTGLSTNSTSSTTSSSGTNFTTIINNMISTATSAMFGVGTNGGAFNSSLPGGLSYFGNIGPTWDVALQAIASDNSATVIQRPRIQTSQAKAASFFVGQTVPYVTSTFSGGVDGNSSSYSQLSVGVELDVTPFINPDGLVVMDINQEIDDLNGSTEIEGVGAVPNTIKRTLNSEIAVKDRDTIMLGGFVRSDKSTSKSGVPWLQDIPIIGNLFSQRNDSKDRNETVVLIRPTVLRTPEFAAAQALKEEQRLPGIAHAEANDDADAQSQIEAERKAELKAAKARKHNAGVFTPPDQIDTNDIVPLAPYTNNPAETLY
jgi:general secretion pathway protein D